MPLNFTKKEFNVMIKKSYKERNWHGMEVTGSADGPTSIIVSQQVSGMSMVGIFAIAAIVVVIIGVVAWAFTRNGKE